MSDVFNMADTWNAGATTFTAIKMDVTDTASAAASKLLELLVAGVSKFSVRKDGLVTFAGDLTFPTTVVFRTGATAIFTMDTSGAGRLYPTNDNAVTLGVSNRQFTDGFFSTSLNISQAAIPAGGTTGVGLKFSSTANFGIFAGSGAPSLSAAKGSLYLRSDGSTTNDRAYINTNGTTTWTALTTAA